MIATFVKRLNRFVAEVEIDGELERVHVPSTGRMKELLVAGAPVALKAAEREGRKTRYDLWAVDHGGVWVCVDARAANDVAAGLLEASLAGGGQDGDAGGRGDGGRDDGGRLDPGLCQALRPLVRGMTGFRKEAKFGPHRFDFVIYKGDLQAVVEVKSVNLVEGGVAKFPDAPTSRGASHVRFLCRRARDGGEAHALFVVQRSDARLFQPNREADPEFAAALSEAAQSGVGVAALVCEVSPGEIKATRSLPVELEPS